MVEAQQEIELKFVLSEAALDQLRWEVFGSAAPRPLRSIYFDTPDQRLATAGLAVRLRHDGERWVQTVKGAGAISRFEDEVARETPELDVERLRAASGEVGAAVIEALAPIFEVQVERRTLDIGHGQAMIELALDDGAVRAGSAEAPVRELELELKTGALPDLFAAARAICMRPGVQLYLTSKAEQGYRLAEDQALEPLHFHAPPLPPGTSVQTAFQALALRILAQLCSAAWLVRIADAPEPVHQARVALRRLRVVVGAFKTVVVDARVEAIKAELKRMTDLFADARSLDVFAEDAGITPEIGEGAAALRGAVQRAQAAAHAKAQRGVCDVRFAEGLLDIAEWALCGGWTCASETAALREQPIGVLAHELIRHRRRRMRKRGRRLDWADAPARHKLRIQAKKMRYLVDALAPERTDAGLYRRLKRLQACLGDLNDIATAADTARLALGSAAPAEMALAAGLMIGKRQARSEPLVRRAERAFRKWAKTPPI